MKSSAEGDAAADTILWKEAGGTSQNDSDFWQWSYRDASSVFMDRSLNSTTQTALDSVERSNQHQLKAGSAGTYTFRLQMIDSTLGTTVLAETDDLTVTIGPDQSAPVGLAGVAPTTSANTDGMIIGTTTDMEYKLTTADDNLYAPCSDTTTRVEVPGTYVVRYAAQAGYNAGATAEVTLSFWDVADVGVEYQGFVDESNGGWILTRAMLEEPVQNFSFDAIQVNLLNAPTGAKINYCTYNGPDDITGLGWLAPVSNGETAGSEIQDEQKHPIEAIELELENMPDYSVIYQVNVKDQGWQSWVRDDEMAGTTGQRLPIEAIRIRIIKMVP